MMNRILYIASVVAVGALVTSPALAGARATPAPIAGLGIGAVALLGAGYRALKNRSRR